MVSPDYVTGTLVAVSPDQHRFAVSRFPVSAPGQSQEPTACLEDPDFPPLGRMWLLHPLHDSIPILCQMSIDFLGPGKNGLTGVTPVANPGQLFLSLPEPSRPLLGPKRPPKPCTPASCSAQPLPRLDASWSRETSWGQGGRLLYPHSIGSRPSLHVTGSSTFSVSYCPG